MSNKHSKEIRLLRNGFQSIRNLWCSARSVFFMFFCVQTYDCCVSYLLLWQQTKCGQLRHLRIDEHGASEEVSWPPDRWVRGPVRKIARIAPSRKNAELRETTGGQSLSSRWRARGRLNFFSGLAVLISRMTTASNRVVPDVFANRD